MDWNFWISLVSALAAIAAAVVCLAQTKAAFLANRAQSIVSLIALLQEDDVHHARGLVRRDADSVAIGEISPEELRKARVLVCNSYDLAALLVREGVVPEHVLVDNWGASIIDCYEKLRDHIAETRRGPSGDWHWRNFEWLYGRAVWANSESRHPPTSDGRSGKDRPRRSDLRAM